MGKLNALKERSGNAENFAVLDIEAANWTEFKLAGFFDGESFSVFRKIGDFFDAVFTRKNRGLTIYSHFGGAYDFLFVLEELLRRESLKFEIIDVQGRILSLKIFDGVGNTWKLVDSYFLLMNSLDKLGDIFQVTHKKKKFDIAKAKFDNSDMTEIINYLRYDCISLFEILKTFAIWTLNNGRLEMSIAGQAMYVFRKEFFNEDFDLRNFDAASEAFLRRGYFGGRVEIFKMYGKGLNYYDVNSLYPSVMLEDMPCGDALWTDTFMKNRIGFYQCRVEYPQGIKIPNLPYYDMNLKTLLFPVGKFEGIFSSIELERAFSLGAKAEILNGIYFDKSAKVFESYVKYFYNVRQGTPKDSADNVIAKYFLNSLYGKFAQKREREKVIVSDFKTAADLGAKPYLEEYSLYSLPCKSKAPFIIPSISAWITALARDKLYAAIQRIGYDSIYYCDTDSLITTARLPVSDELGGWKKEFSDFSGVFLLPKLYAIKGKDFEHVKAKGFPAGAFDFYDLEQSLLKGVKLQYDFEKNSKYREGLKRFKKPLHRFKITKRVFSVYNKRKIFDNYDTFPLTLGS